MQRVSLPWNQIMHAQECELHICIVCNLLRTLINMLRQAETSEDRYVSETWNSLSSVSAKLQLTRPIMKITLGSILAAEVLTHMRQCQIFLVLLVIADSIIIYCGGGVHGVAFMHPDRLNLVHGEKASPSPSPISTHLTSSHQQSRHCLHILVFLIAEFHQYSFKHT